MPSGEQLSCGQSASTDIRHVKHHGISSLPDEMLFKILRDVPQYPSDLVLVAKLPFVCKKWREVLYLQGRPLQEIYLNYQRFHSKYYTLTAIGQWLVLQQNRGSLRHPWTLRIVGNHNHGDESPQVFHACLGLLGPVLYDLHMEHCWGTLFTSESLRLLWICPCLRNLTLSSGNGEVMAEEVVAGLQHLRQLEFLSICTVTYGHIDPGRVNSMMATQVLCSLSNLHTLRLEGQNLTGSPSLLSHLSQLHTLRVYQCTWHCRVTGPIALGCCIEDLDLAYVWIQLDDMESSTVSFPQLVLWESLPSLAKVSMNFIPKGHQGKFAMFPSGVLACTQLCTLSLRGYEVPSTQPGFTDLCKLTALELEECLFEKVPAWVPQLASLQCLDLICCTMPWEQCTWKSSAPTLRTLHCFDTAMHKVCPSLCTFTTMTELTLDYCRLTTIHPAVSNLVNLLSLDLSNNNLYPEVPQELAKLTTLTSLNLFYNREAIAVGLSELKMRVTPGNCRFLLQFPVLAKVSLEVTQEEEDALAEFLTELQRGRNIPIIVDFDNW